MCRCYHLQAISIAFFGRSVRRAVRLDVQITFFFLAHHQFMDVKSEKHRMHFLVKKGVKIKPNNIFWAATNIFWVVSFTDFELWSFCQTKSWKLQNTVFGYKKGLKNSMPLSFLIRDLNIVGSFICYFWFITILSSQKLKNAKYRFGLLKSVFSHTFRPFSYQTNSFFPKKTLFLC